MSDRELINAVVKMLNDYGSPINGELRVRAVALVEEGQTARERAAMMAEQASYALRYRHGEDLTTLQKSCKGIVLINQ